MAGECLSDHVLILRRQKLERSVMWFFAGGRLWTCFCGFCDGAVVLTAKTYGHNDKMRNNFPILAKLLE